MMEINTIPLKKVLKFDKGKNPKDLVKEPLSNEYLPYLEADYFRTGRPSQFALPDDVKIADDDDLIMIFDGSKSGEIFRNVRKGIVASTMVKLLFDREKFNSHYLQYFVQYYFLKLNEGTTGSGIPHLNQETFFGLQLPNYKPEQQEIIALELKSKLEKVEQMRQAALQQKEAVEALQGALLREVFPYKEGDELPEGWKWEKIGKLCKVQAGGTPSRTDISYWTNGTIPWLKTGEIFFNEINNSEEFITENALENSAAKLIPAQSVLIALYGQGKTRGRVAINNLELTTNQACAAIIPPKNLLTKYLFYYLWANYETLRELSSGSNQDNLNADLIKTFGIPIPASTSTQQEIVNVVSKKINVQIKLQQQTITQLEAIEALPAAILREVFEFKTINNE